MQKSLLPYLIGFGQLTNRIRINTAIFRHPTGSSLVPTDGQDGIPRRSRHPIIAYQRMPSTVRIVDTGGLGIPRGKARHQPHLPPSLCNIFP